MSKKDKGVVEYDICGQICPSCLLMTLKEVNQHQDAIRSGQMVFRVMTDNRQATATIPNAVRNMGYAVDVKKSGGHYRITISAAGTSSLMMD